jgi:hypothetical protein
MGVVGVALAWRENAEAGGFNRSSQHDLNVL